LKTVEDELAELHKLVSTRLRLQEYDLDRLTNLIAETRYEIALLTLVVAGLVLYILFR